MADIAHAELAGEPGDAPLLADAADLGHVRLNDVEGAAHEPGPEALAPRQHFAAGDRDRACLTQPDIVVERVAFERFLEPGDVVACQHLRGAHRPFEPVRPEGVAAAGIDHQGAFHAGGVARGNHDGLVEAGVAAAAERPPADLERPEPQGAELRHVAVHRLRLVHQQRAIGLDAVAVAPAEEPSDRLARGLAEDVPQRDVDAADGVGQGAAMAHPEGVLLQLLGDPLRLERIFTAVQRFEHRERGLDEAMVGEHAAMAADAFVGMHRNQRMNRVRPVRSRRSSRLSASRPSARPLRWILSSW